MLVIRDLVMFGRRTYGEFLNAGEGIATNVLADRLKRLEEDGLLVREADPERSSRPRYRPTQKALDLLPVLLEMAAWSGTWDEQTVVPRELVERIRHDRASVEREILACYERDEPWMPGVPAREEDDGR